jgi:hypothetical protein
MPELIEDGETGFLVEDFVQGFHLVDEAFSMDREYIANRARKLFNFHVMTKQYVRAYKKVRRIYRLKEREERKIQKITTQSRKELETVWARDIRRRDIQQRIRIAKKRR